MQVVSFMNMKGGVGKTTLAVNIGYALAHQHWETSVDGRWRPAIQRYPMPYGR